MKRVLFGNRVIAMLLCLVMLSGVILTSCNKGSDSPVGTSGKATDAESKPEETQTPEIAAETVSFDQTAVTMTVGDTVVLVATVLPSNTTDKSITYSSSNPAVAVAVNGTVTAAGVGTAVIIATTSNGKTAICTVTVTSSTVAVSGISLDKTALSLVVGDTEVLTAAVMPADATDKTVTWTSSDTAIATVENGIVTAKKAGTAVVIATTSNGKAATCTVTVRNSSVIAAGVTLDKSTMSLVVGNMGVLTATVVPDDTTDKSVMWSSSDPSVATVENGRVTAVGEGTATITVTTSNGKTATCTVTVTTSVIDVTGVTLNKTELSLTVGGSATLTATVTPADATDTSVTWYSSNPSVVTVENGVVTARGAGSAIVTVTTSNGKTAFCTVTVRTPAVDVTGVTLNKTELSLTVGESATLTATLTPANATVKTVTWRSSDALVITVKNGVVTAVGVGTATVTVTTSNGKTAICTVTVKEKVIPSGLNFALTLNDSFYIVTGYYGNATEYTIPAIYDGLRVIGIQSNAFRNNTNLKKITIPSNIEVIGASAFAGCTALTEIAIPESVTKIEESTFFDCTSLKEIRIHGKIKTVGSNAFAGCIALTDLTIENGVTEIGAFAFDRCTGLVSVELPDSVTLVGNGAFRHAEALETVKLSKNMTAINNITFQYCESLKSVSLHSGITQIGNSAFSFCYGLEKLEILGDLTDIGNSAFYHCEKLNEIFYASKIGGDLGKTHYTFCRAGLGGTGIRLTIAAGAVVPEGLFEPFEEANRPKITEIVFEDGTGQVEYFAVYSNFTYLKKITIPHSVKSIPSGMLKGCADLTVAMEDEHYTFRAWYDNSAFTGDAVNPTDYAGEAERLYALWEAKSQSVIAERNTEAAGTVSGSGDYPYGSKVTLAATTNTGYSFLGWFDGETLLSEEADYTFVIVADLILTAKWKGNPYTVTIDKNISEAGSVSGDGEYEFGTSVTVTAQSNTGYTFIGWYRGDVLVSESENYTFTMPEGIALTAKWKVNRYTVTIDKNISEAGSVSGDGEYEFGTSVTVTAQSNIGYTFIGWYRGDVLVSESESYTFTTLDGIALTAKWKVNRYSVTIEKNISEAGSVSGDGIYDYHSKITVKAITNMGYIFLGWYKNGTLLTTALEYSFTIEARDCEMEARWKEDDVFIFEINETSCIVTGVRDKTATEYIIPDYVTGIGVLAFYCCSNMTSITIPNSVTSIGENAFSCCSGLTSIVVAENNKVYHSFKNCLIETQSKTLILGCRNSEIPPDGSVTGIGSHAFSWCSLASITIPDNVTSIGENAFYYCHNLTSITIPDSVTSIGSSAFEDCSSLTSITIPKGVTSIGSSAFRLCSSLTSITIPDSVISIGDYAFYYCRGLMNITIPDSVTSIGSSAFYNCSSLTSITIPGSVTSIGENAFSRCSGLTSIVVAESNKVYHSFKNCLIETQSKTLILGCKNSEIPMDGSVTGIGSSAFKDCSSLTSITIPNSVTSIGSSAFEDCMSLTNITIPESVTSIGALAFYNCSSLTSITIPDSVTSIGDCAFYYCSRLTSITFEDTSTWYTTTNEADWTNKSGGTVVDVSDPTKNATTFRNSGRNYWYKL